MASHNWKAVKRHHAAKSAELQKYFEHLPSLIEKYPREVTLAYVFSRIEGGQNRALYCGVVKLHRAHGEVAAGILETHHLTRVGFVDHFKVIFGAPLDPNITAKIKFSEKIRDKVVHGKSVNDAEMRKAIVEALDYADDLNSFISKIADFRPFGDLRGFKGRGKPLEKSTTRWLLKGLGF